MNDEIEVERYELDAPAPYRFEVERRDFMRIFALLGGGLLVAASAPPADAQESGRGAQNRSVPRDVAGWLHIDEKGHVTAYTGKTEIGQNVRTSLAQAIADELRIPLSSVTMTMADTDVVPYDAGTFGSQSTPRMAPVLSRAAATAREMLIDRAAALWNTDRTALSAKDGQIVGAGRTIAYGELTKGQKLTGEIPAQVAATPPARWSVRGTAWKKVNGREFVTGRHAFTPDVVRPRMQHGRVIRPAGYAGTLVSVDDSRARALPGTTVVRDGEFLGVVAPTERAAVRAASAVRAEWKLRTGDPSSQTIYEHLKQTGQEEGGRNSRTVAGDPSAGRA
jgi:isoquinoline 1-oxidoreductase